MKWYIGQDIVCIKSHSQGLVKEGDIFTIKGLKKACCPNETHIDVGITCDINTLFVICTACKNIYTNDGIHWLSEFRFAPLESITDISEIEELLKEPIFQS